MALTPLSPLQQTAINELVAQSRLAEVPPDPNRASSFTQQAEDAIADLPHLTKAQNRYTLAYDACHDLGEAVLAAYGYRTLSGPGQHETIGRFLRAVLSSPPGQEEAQHFERLRRSRNQLRYSARPVGEGEAQLAVETATGLLHAIVQRGITR